MMGNNVERVVSMAIVSALAGTVAIVATASPAIGMVVGLGVLSAFTVNWAVKGTIIRRAVGKSKAKAIEPTTVSNGDGSLAGWADELRLREENSWQIARINWQAANDAAVQNPPSLVRPYGRVELEIARRIHELVAEAWADDAALARHDLDLLEAAIEAAEEVTLPARMTGEWRGVKVSVDA